MKRSITVKNFFWAICTCIACAICSAPALAAKADKAEKEFDDGPAPIKLEELHKSKPASRPTETQPAAPMARADKVKAPEKPGVRWSIADENISHRLGVKDTIVPVTAPKGLVLRRNIRNQPLPVEGTAVVNRDGSISLDEESGWLIMTFENQPGREWIIPRRLLQCRLLEKVEGILSANPNTRFAVVGETTVHDDSAYLLFRRVAVLESPPPPKPPKPAPDKTAPKPLVISKKSEPEKNESKTSAGDVEKKDTEKAPTTTTELISALLKDKPRTALRVEPDPNRSASENIESVAPAGKEPLSPGRKGLVIDRVVRIVKGPAGYWWEARFQSDNTLREPPMRVLPNGILSHAVRLNSQMGRGSLKLRVSGEITFYKGRRYLLIRKLLRQRDMEQF